jgi:hypothetical protein
VQSIAILGFPKVISRDNAFVASAQSIMASGFTAAQTGRTHDRTRPMLQLGQKVLAKAPSTHDKADIEQQCG